MSSHEANGQSQITTGHLSVAWKVAKKHRSISEWQKAKGDGSAYIAAENDDSYEVKEAALLLDQNESVYSNHWEGPAYRPVEVMSSQFRDL